MTFSLYMQAFRDGRLAPISRATVDAEFDPYVVDRDPAFIRIRYPDQSGAEIWMNGGKGELDNITFKHCGGEAFSHALYSLAKRTGSVIYWPGGGCVVTDPAVTSSLPYDLVATLGTPMVVKSGAEIFDHIAKS
jgi:hypothetical protein